MPKNIYGDRYNDDDYNGDPTFNGRVETTENKAKQKASEWLEGTFVENILPKYFPDIKDFFESFRSPTEPGEFQVDQDKDHEGRVQLFIDVCVTPEIYSYLENGHWDELYKSFEQACQGANTKRPISGEVLSNNDNPESPTVHFGITAY